MAVSIDKSLATSMDFAARNGGTFPILNIPDRRVIADTDPLYNVPTHMFTDVNGVARAIIAGPLNTTIAVAQSEALLAPPPRAS